MKKSKRTTPALTELPRDVEDLTAAEAESVEGGGSIGSAFHGVLQQLTKGSTQSPQQEASQQAASLSPAQAEATRPA